MFITDFELKAKDDTHFSVSFILTKEQHDAVASQQLIPMLHLGIVKEFLSVVNGTVRKGEKPMITDTEMVCQIGNFVMEKCNVSRSGFRLRNIVSGNIYNLTNKMYNVVKFMIMNLNEEVQRGDIAKFGWHGQDDYFTCRSMDVCVTNVRKIFKEDNSVRITNIPGFGYKMETQYYHQI